MGKPREPSLGIDLRFIEEVPAIAASAKKPEAVVGWGMVKLWKFCWAAKKAEVSSLLLDGFVPGCTEALVAFEMLRPTGPDTFEVAGLGRYLRTKEAQAEAGRRAGAYRAAQQAAHLPAEQLSGMVSGVVSGMVSGVVSARQIEDRRSLTTTDPDGSVGEHQTELPIDDPEEPEVDEPDRPLAEVSQKPHRRPPAARQLSAAEEVWVQMVDERRTRLEALQLDHEPDEKPAPAFINAGFKRIIERMRESDETANEYDVALAWQRYLESHWGQTREPPFALQAFMSESVWRKHWECIGGPKDPLRAQGQ